MRSFFSVVTLVLVIALPARAQQRPLPIESSAGVGEGNVSVSIGADYTRAARFPLSGLEGDLWRVALVRIDVGLSSIADLELSGGLRDHLTIASSTSGALSNELRLSDPSSTGAFDDIIVGTKVRLVNAEGDRPGVAVRVATRLPNAKHPSGLGQNTTDFFGSVLIDGAVTTLHLTGNVGLGILGDPLQGNRRVRSLLFNVALSHPVQQHVVVAAGVDGRTGPLEPGLEPRAIGRAGVSWTHDMLRVGADATLGLTDRDGNVGMAISAQYTFHAFKP
jgi:hypothetical protein